MVTLQLQQLQVPTKDLDLPPTYFEVVRENDLDPPPPYYSSVITPPKSSKQIEADPTTSRLHPALGPNSGRSSSEIPTISQQVPIIPIPIAAIHASNRHHNQQSRSRRHATRHVIPMYHQPSRTHSTTKLCVLIFLLVVMIPVLIWFSTVWFNFKLLPS
ncbi:unnamed protein product [Allacma fusca]|uniref:Uncharacterized protein n=1 Tax=Allacma fusca TaxID=39272 RepID=A0A8J2KR26_9HEXA|nr:unnamed protein product [Allacma fusca]